MLANVIHPHDLDVGHTSECVIAQVSSLQGILLYPRAPIGLTGYWAIHGTQVLQEYINRKLCYVSFFQVVLRPRYVPWRLMSFRYSVGNYESISLRFQGRLVEHRYESGNNKNQLMGEKVGIVVGRQK